MTEQIILENVFKKYPANPKKWAVRDINLTIQSGEFFCLVGLSGCGKSTLLKLISGIEKATSGSISAPQNISMVFQSGALFPWLNVSDNVAFGLKMVKAPKQKRLENIQKYLRMAGLFGFDKKFPRELSGGQRQRVGIARALAVEPAVLLLDEPFSALDSLTTQSLHKDLLKIWTETKITVVMVSHLLEEAILLANRVGVMADGSLKGILEINLDRPRQSKSDNFYHLEDKLTRLMM